MAVTDISTITFGSNTYNLKDTSKYEKPSTGIPDTDIASAATWNAKGTYSKPSGGIPDTDIASAATWNAKATKPTKKSIFLSATWSGSGPYTQTVTVSGYTITANSKVDLQLDATTINQLITDGVKALYIENNNGTLTAYAIGAAPTAAMTIQCTVVEVDTPTVLYIHFNIGSTTYQAEEGMTWEEWVNSSYNTRSLYTTSTRVKFFDNMVLAYMDENPVDPTEQINNGGSYRPLIEDEVLN